MAKSSEIVMQKHQVKYKDGLDSQEKARYEGKLQLIDDEDPYEMTASMFSEDVKLLPKITYPDIVNYLVFSPSPYTSDDLKSYKGLEAYNQFVCGWVRDKATQVINNKCLVKAKVLHSQRMSEKPLQPWFIAEKEGRILAAHCTCMAGLGEVCTHVAALLFAVDASVQLRESKTITEEKSYWLLPTSVKGVSYKQVRDIDFTSAKTMKKKLDAKLKSGDTTPTICKQKVNNIPDPTVDELSLLFKSLSEINSKPGILSLIPEYQEIYVPQPMKENFLTILTEMRDDSALELNYVDLLKEYGIVTCDCCGQAVVEIKCPFCKKHDSLENVSDDKNFYLKKDNDGNLKLDTKHMYYYQVQTQLGVCQMESGYFVVWTEKDLHIEQIVFNNELWKEICDKSKHLFITAILPELIGKFYSRLPNRQPLKPVVNNNLCEKESKSKDNEEELWCFCAQVESGKMIYCDNEECPIQWFHYTCLGISCAPRGKWYCPDCRKLSKFRRKRGKKNKN
ncbi:unnamed protein product [Mytilus coruscus]|uniref:PHD-type domain-containing protein n=1 Tax=Mytilus coruscus TaxID=42192 RepID=A0A6J8CMK1_MYTCO|nr:unnamed protein product [Mytilus coruscus]